MTAKLIKNPHLPAMRRFLPCDAMILVEARGMKDGFPGFLSVNNLMSVTGCASVLF